MPKLADAVTRHANVSVARSVAAWLSSLSVAVTVAVPVPTAAGVPDTTRVAESRATPPGCPVTV